MNLTIIVKIFFKLCHNSQFHQSIKANFAVYKNQGVHEYSFPQGEKGIYFDLGYSFNNAFIEETHQIKDNILSGWIRSKTTCNRGIYKIFYAIKSK